MKKGMTRSWGNLRQRAQERLRERKQEANLPMRDPERLVYELEVHQMELEIQNEELRESRVELESALGRYTEIFDFAPIGYVTITLDGTIREVNHAASRLLGEPRSRLSGENLGKRVTGRHKPTFTDLLQNVLTSDDRGSCELELLLVDGHLKPVQLVAALLARAEPLILLTLQEPHQLLGQAPLESGMHPAASGDGMKR